jgi:coronin-1B/1C/6
MSGRFVRASKFRHVHGEPAALKDCFTELRPETTGEGNYIKSNSTYWAMAVQGGGGPVIVHPIKNPIRFPAAPSVLNVHKAKVLDMDFSPFHENLIATGSEDSSIKVSQIPGDGAPLEDHITQEAANLSGHEKRVGMLHWHPVADNILASSGYDNVIKVWDVEAQSEALSFNGHPDFIQSFEWNRKGSQIATTCKDKNIRIYDPRNSGAVATVEGHQGSKSSRIVWMENHNVLAACGFSKTSVRKILLWDPRNLGAAISEVELDQSAGVLMPFYDEDTSVLYVAGKGDGNIRYFEIVDEAPFIHSLDEFRSNTPHKGVCFSPKTAVDYMGCEVALCFRVLRDVVEPVHFVVPRKSELFQTDLFPDTYAGKAALTNAAYLEGKDADPVVLPLQEAAAGVKSASGSAVTFKAKKSPAELEKELAEALARIKELEAEVARLKK